MHAISEPTHWMALSLTADGQIASLSGSAESLIGYSPRELVGRSITVILGDRSTADFAQMMKLALDWGVWEGEIEHRDRGGNTIRGRATLAPLTTHENACAGFLLLSDLNQQAARDEAGSTLRAISTYLRRTAHELNNPLAVIMGFTQLVLMDPHCEGKLRADVEHLYAETTRIVQIVERLHAYAVSLQEKPSEPEEVRATN